jgi:hypothetical protein
MRSKLATRSFRASPVSGRAEGFAVSSLLRVRRAVTFFANGAFRRLVAQDAATCFSLRALEILSAVLLLSTNTALFMANPALAADKEKPVAWKPLQQALLRVDDQPVKNWNVYQESKKADPLLLEMNNRFLLIQIHDRKIFELAPAKIERKGADLLWDPYARPANPLATSDWVIRDVGFAYRISVRLAAENHLLDLQLPHPMDLRYL